MHTIPIMATRNRIEVCPHCTFVPEDPPFDRRRCSQSPPLYRLSHRRSFVHTMALLYPASLCTTAPLFHGGHNYQTAPGGEEELTTETEGNAQEHPKKPQQSHRNLQIAPKTRVFSAKSSTSPAATPTSPPRISPTFFEKLDTSRSPLPPSKGKLYGRKRARRG